MKKIKQIFYSIFCEENFQFLMLVLFCGFGVSVHFYSLEMGVVFIIMMIIGSIISGKIIDKNDKIKEAEWAILLAILFATIIACLSLIPAFFVEKFVIKPKQSEILINNIMKIQIQIDKEEPMIYEEDVIKDVIVDKDKKKNNTKNKDDKEEITGIAIVKYKNGKEKEFTYSKKSGSYGCITCLFEKYYIKDE